MHRWLAASGCLVLIGCSPSTAAAIPSPSPSPFADGSPTGAAVKMAGGCGATQVYKGGEPDWLTQAGDDNNPNDLPYFITDPPIAAGFIFGYPLHARVSPGQGNKILWVVGIPRDGNPLRIDGHPLNATTPKVDESFPDNASPGEIYPSEVDVLSPGCWHFDITWGPNKTSVDLIYT
jgi:hypothetical protein